MEIFKLVGVAIVVVGFALKFDTLLTVVVAGMVTGLVAGMSFMEVLDTMGRAFVDQRLATLFVLTLPVVGICERYGLKQMAQKFVSGIQNVTAGKVMSIYVVLRSISSAFSLRMGGHAQFIRPFIHPMIHGAAVNSYGVIDEDTEEILKGRAAAMENIAAVFAQNVFMGSPGCLLVVSVLGEQGYKVDALHVALWSIPIAVAAVILSIIQNIILDRRLREKYATREVTQND
jgi:uncharacterized membrane protein